MSYCLKKIFLLCQVDLHSTRAEFNELFIIPITYLALDDLNNIVQPVGSHYLPSVLDYVGAFNANHLLSARLCGEHGQNSGATANV